MTLYAFDLIRVSASGQQSVVEMTVQDGDDRMSYLDTTTTYTLNGVVLSTRPDVTSGYISCTTISGAWMTYGISFTVGTDTYYSTTVELPADAILSVDAFDPVSPVNFPYGFFGGIDAARGQAYQGKAFVTRAEPYTDSILQFVFDISVHDDDGQLNLTGEPGATAIAHYDSYFLEAPFGTSSGYPLDGFERSTLDHVHVDYVDTDGNAGSFDGILFVSVRYGYVFSAYLPETGSDVDLNRIASITGTTVLAGSIDGASYADFGLTLDGATRNGTTGNDRMMGTWLNDAFYGVGGSDFLVGGTGSDRLFGGDGFDRLYGGMNGDTLYGGAGRDLLYGRFQDDLLAGDAGNDQILGGSGNDSLLGDLGDDVLNGGAQDDSLDGGAGNDKLFGLFGHDTLVGGSEIDVLNGGAGNDLLDGGDGDDNLNGVAGNDSLIDGFGADTLTGGTGADVFILNLDGATDTITDYRDGLDKIDLSVVFADLVITDVGAGRVQIDHSGDILLVTSTTPGFSAASLTASDFLWHLGGGV